MGGTADLPQSADCGTARAPSTASASTRRLIIECNECEIGASAVAEKGQDLYCRSCFIACGPRGARESRSHGGGLVDVRENAC